MVGHEPQHGCVHFLPKTKLREHYDKNGNPIAWLFANPTNRAI